MPSAPSPSATAGSSSAFSVSSTVSSSPSAVTSVAPTTCVGDAAEARAGAVGAGRDGARDRLPVDVAEVRHREAVRGEQPRDAGAGACRRAASRGRARGRRATSPVRSVRSSSTPGATAMPVKLWPAPTALTACPRAAAAVDRALDGLDGARELDALRAHRRRAAPVLPRAARSGHRNAFPSPRYVGASPTIAPSSTR